MLKDYNDAGLHEWVWQKHQVMCDIYNNLVVILLESEACFGWDDLRKLVENNTITGPWDEQVWRDVISRRPENRNKPVPGRFVA
jgi:hypothetical protein